MTRLAWLALAIYVAGRLYLLLHGQSATNPLGLAATKIKANVGALELVFDNGKTSVTASLGVTASKPQDERLDAVIARADTALYEAKARGRDNIGIA